MFRIRVCQGINCQNFLSEDLFRHAQKLTADNPDIEIEKRGCMNLCSKAPNIQVIDESGKSEVYSEIDHKKLEKLLKNLN